VYALTGAGVHRVVPLDGAGQPDTEQPEQQPAQFVQQLGMLMTTRQATTFLTGE